MCVAETVTPISKYGPSIVLLCCTYQYSTKSPLSPSYTDKGGFGHSLCRQSIGLCKMKADHLESEYVKGRTSISHRGSEGFPIIHDLISLSTGGAGISSVRVQYFVSTFK